MTVLLTLGNVTFEDFEVPETINFGGEQKLVTHKFPGGIRVVDAMGADDSEIAWSGRFRGAFAESRARQLDRMRRDGPPLTLSWSSLLFVVVIREFKAEFRQPFEIPYHLACAVLVNPGVAQPPPAPTVDDLIGGDLADALGLSGATQADVAAGIANVQTQIQEVGTLVGIPPSKLAPIQSALNGAQAANSAAFGIANATINGTGIGGVIAGGQVAAMASGLTATSAALSKASALFQTGSLLGRAAGNLGRIGG